MKRDKRINATYGEKSGPAEAGKRRIASHSCRHGVCNDDPESRLEGMKIEGVEMWMRK